MRSPPTFHLNRTALGASSATVAQLGVQKPRAANVANTNSAWDTPHAHPPPMFIPTTRYTLTPSNFGPPTHIDS